MLLHFAVTNFRSLRDKTELSMMAASEAPWSHDSKAIHRISPNLSVLRCAAIYGANASGKSNLIEALVTARTIVCRGGDTPSAHLPFEPFRLDEDLPHRPTEFEFYLLIEDRTYKYVFSTTRDAIVHESLYRAEGDEEQPLFHRSAGEIELSDEIRAQSEDPGFLGYVAKGTPKNRLFIYESQTRNVDAHDFRSIYEWFENHLAMIHPEAEYHDLAKAADSDPALRQFLANTLTWADTGITDLVTKHIELDSETTTQISKLMNEPNLHFLPLAKSRSRVSLLNHDENDMELVSLRAIHGSKSEKTYEFGFEDESDGTRRLLDLTPMLYFGRSKPSAFVIDELDRSLHTLLAQRLVETFLLDLPSTTQIIFTTHDTNLLDCKILRPDCIWFTEKGQEGNTSLYSLAEFKSDQVQALRSELERGYLRGRFGGIPFFNDPGALGWFSSDTDDD